VTAAHLLRAVKQQVDTVFEKPSLVFGDQYGWFGQLSTLPEQLLRCKGTENLSRRSLYCLQPCNIFQAAGA